MIDVTMRLRSLVRRTRGPAPPRATDEGCAWDAMRAAFEAQARRGDPAAIRGLALIDEGRWPSSGQPRGR